MNSNKLILTKQRKLLLLITGSLIALMATLWFINKKASTSSEGETAQIAGDVPAPEPDLTGAVTNTFDSSVQSSIIVDAQMQQKETTNALKEIQTELSKVTNKLGDMNSENQALKSQLSELKKQMDEAKNSPMPPQQNMAPGRGASGGQTEYRMGPPPVRVGQLDSAVFDYSAIDKGKKKSESERAFYVPTGTFSNAIIIEGADANASVRGESKLVPMQFKLTGLAHLPGNQRLDKLKDCFVTAAAFGEISSERAVVQLQRLSCIINGKHIDQEVKGHVAFYGKNGIKGVPVMRNGKILGLAFGAGALGGVGQSVSQIGQTVAGLGATATTSAGDVARSAIGGGASTAANKLADYYIDAAEQYHPIIPIGAGNRVEVVFIEGFSAEFIEDKQAAEAEKKQPQQPNGSQMNDVQKGEYGNSGLPPELIGQLGDAQTLNLSDFVTPSKGR
ncbi:TrbI/VirB10 family protein [Serratia sp. UGAL515B_01]|uniref:TrbI/VirB10 family protein n=1 Tax=Serratia sp. UGAL515B_01 TaxID=2986763 RepID=UPI002953DB6F|nr:TrbI/VirB10 family protein [Serratia sp. UGAL515B_01]WON75524.1 conjugal transfer protein TraB [Serratia sp. UGAL515B_01]